MIVSVVPEKAVVTLVPPAKSIALPEATAVGPPVSPWIDHVYVPGILAIVAHLFVLVKYLSPAAAVPSTADRSKVIIGLGVVPVTVPVIKLPAGNVYSFKLTKVSVAFE